MDRRGGTLGPLPSFERSMSDRRAHAPWSCSGRGAPVGWVRGRWCRQRHFPWSHLIWSQLLLVLFPPPLPPQAETVIPSSRATQINHRLIRTSMVRLAPGGGEWAAKVAAGHVRSQPPVCTRFGPAARRRALAGESRRSWGLRAG